MLRRPALLVIALLAAFVAAPAQSLAISGPSSTAVTSQEGVYGPGTAPGETPDNEVLGEDESGGGGGGGTQTDGSGGGSGGAGTRDAGTEQGAGVQQLSATNSSDELPFTGALVAPIALTGLLLLLLGLGLRKSVYRSRAVQG